MDPNADTVRSMSELLKKSDDDLDDPDGDLLPQITITGAELLEGHNARNNASRLHHQDSITKRFHVTPAENNRDRSEVTSVGSSLGLSISGISDDEAYEISKTAKSRSHRCANPKELKLKIFVIILFGIIIAGLVLTFHFYNKQKNIVEVGKKIYFDEDSRRLSVTNVVKDTVLVGHLGHGLDTHHLPFECSDESSRSSELCLFWKDKANLTITYLERNNANCYNISWQSLTDQVIPWDCYEFGDAYWYGGGLFDGLKWPLRNATFEKTPYVLSSTLQSEPFGPVLEPYWLTSKGVAIFVHEGYPLHVSLNATSPNSQYPDGKLCFYADYKDSPYFNPNDELPALQYTICVAENIKIVHEAAIQKIARPPTKLPDKTIFESPVWSTWAFFKNQITDQLILDYAEEINQKEFGHSMLIIDDGWQSTNGDFTFDATKFSNVSHFVDRLKAMNFNISISINPFVNFSSDAFQEAMSKSYTVLDASGQVPGMVSWWNGQETDKRDPTLVAVIDMHDSSKSWFSDNLQNLLQVHKIDSLRAGGGESTFLPYKAHFHDKDFTTPNQYAELYAELVSGIGSTPQIQTAYKSQHLATLPRLYDADSSWDSDRGLLTIIPRYLTMGLLGYCYPIPDPAGGSAYMNSGNDKNLFLRWLEMQTFFPIMHLSAPPFHFGLEAEETARDLFKKHKEFLDTILELAEESLKTLKPVVRPLWWIAPTDVTALTTDTEFLLGDKILVAPILDKTENRDIYLPKGMWKDLAEGGPVIEGPATIQHYFAPLGIVPHFELQDE